MVDQHCWSTNAGRWFGVPVRLHMLLFLFVALIFGVQWYMVAPEPEVMGTALVTTVVLLAGVVLHELAHVFALVNLGGHAENLVLAPWGGNSDFSLSEDRSADRLWVYLAGPFMNGALFAVASALLLRSGAFQSISELVNPFRPHGFHMSELWATSLAKITAWVNFQLMVVNLIPAFPFDGQQILRALIEWMNPRISILRRESTLMAFGHAVGLTLIGCALFLKDTTGGTLPPTMVLLLGGITIMFAARYAHERHLEEVESEWDEIDDFDFDSLYGESEYHENGLFDTRDPESIGYSQWLQEKQEERQAAEEERERREELLADDILEKLHAEGLDSLSEEERSILTRVSERIRRRRQQQKADF